MADEIRVTATGTPATPAERRSDIGAPPPAPVVVDDDPDAARAEIENTRARMSETISEIEDVLVRRKEQIQERLDIFSPIKENPLPAGGIAFGAGLLLGLLTGGDDDEDGDGEWREPEPVYASVPWRPRGDRADRWEPRSRSSGLWEPHFNTEEWGRGEEGSLQERAETWERRARRLRDVARRQEEEIRDLQEQWGTQRARGFDQRSSEWEEEDGDGFLSGHLDDLRERIVTGVSGYLTRAVNDVLGQGGASRRA